MFYYPPRYVYNLQGDVMAMVDAAGELVVKYKYDAWGRQFYQTGSMSDTLGTLNPFRYRGYVYDVETELYYLRSRYYSPGIARFINADKVAYAMTVTFFSSLFCYGANNPIRNVDYSGKKHSKQIDVAGGNDNLSTKEKVKNVLFNLIDPYVSMYELHINRNKEQAEYLNALQTELGSEKALISYLKENWIKQPFLKNLFHINPLSSQGLEAFKNVKYMSEDGRYEVVICDPSSETAYIVKSIVNMGTANYGTDTTSHFLLDMITYLKWGNSGFGFAGDMGFDIGNAIVNS